MASELTINKLSPQTVLAHLERIRLERNLGVTFAHWRIERDPSVRQQLWQEMDEAAKKLMEMEYGKE